MAVAMTQIKSSRTQPWPLPAIVAWLIWRRNRTGLSVMAVQIAAFAILAHTVFAGVLEPLNGFWEAPSTTSTYDGPINYILLGLVAAALIAWVTCSGVYLAISVSLIVTEANSAGYPYPLFLLRSPAKTTGLAVWPVLFGMILLTSFWIVCDLAILRPAGFYAPVIVPAIILALTSLFFAAAFWSPLAPILKLLFTLSLGAAVGLVGTFCLHHDNTIFYAVTAAAGSLLMLCAVAGMGRHRCGDIYDVTLPKGVAGLKERYVMPRRPIISAADAQRRLEWVNFGIALPCSLLALTIVTLPSLFDRREYPLGLDFNSALRLQAVQGTLWAQIISVFFFIVPLSTALLSLPNTGNDYIRTRPMSSQALIAARAQVAISSAAQTICIGLVLFALWLLSPGTDGRVHATLAELLIRRGGAVLVPDSLLCALIWALAIVRLRLDGFAVSLSGSLTLGGWNILVVYAALFVTSYVLSHPYDSIRPVSFAFPSWIYAVAALKGLAALSVLLVTYRRRLISGAFLGRAVLLWIAVAATVFSALIALLPGGTLSPFELAVALFLGMPAVRLSLGPILLDRNRHR